MVASVSPHHLRWQEVRATLRTHNTLGDLHNIKEEDDDDKRTEASSQASTPSSSPETQERPLFLHDKV